MDQITPPKRRDRVQTKAKILTAAQQAFSEIGYSQAGIRDIAARADVTSPMLLHYFGSKIGLFEAALIDAMSSRVIFDTPREDFGAQMMRNISNLTAEIYAPALIVLAAGNAEARATAAKVAEREGVLPLAEWLGPPDAHARAVQITMLALSYVLFTRQLPLAAAGSEIDRQVIDWMAEAIQRIVDQL